MHNYYCSLVPRPIPSFSMLHAEKHFSACNIEKLGIPADVSNNVLTVHNTTVVYADQLS